MSIPDIEARAEAATPATSIEAARQHHRTHGDMDGDTCLLTACLLHYPASRIADLEAQLKARDKTIAAVDTFGRTFDRLGVGSHQQVNARYVYEEIDRILKGGA